MYQISTNRDNLKNWFSRNDFIISGSKFGAPEKSIFLLEVVAMESEFGGKDTTLAVIAVLLKSNAKQRDVPALKPERYTTQGVIEAVLAQTDNLIIRFPAVLCFIICTFYFWGISVHD